jgi:hypothetical protein
MQDSPPLAHLGTYRLLQEILAARFSLCYLESVFACCIAICSGEYMP